MHASNVNWRMNGHFVRKHWRSHRKREREKKFIRANGHGKRATYGPRIIDNWNTFNFRPFLYFLHLKTFFNCVWVYSMLRDIRLMQQQTMEWRLQCTSSENVLTAIHSHRSSPLQLNAIATVADPSTVFWTRQTCVKIQFPETSNIRCDWLQRINAGRMM